MYFYPQGYRSVNHQVYTFHSTHHSTYPPQCPFPHHPLPSPLPPATLSLFFEIESFMVCLPPNPIFSFFLFLPPPTPPPRLASPLPHIKEII